MSTPDPQAQLEQLKADHKRITEAVNLRHKQSALTSLESQISVLGAAREKLADAGYIHNIPLTSLANALTAQHFANAKTHFAQISATASVRLAAELAQATPIITSALGGNRVALDPAVEALSGIDSRLSLAEEQLDEALKPTSDARYALDSFIRQLSWSQEEWSEFSGDKSVGAPLVACEAEWIQTGRGGDDPDGVLYLTATHLVFEQKEKKGKTLGMFGGKVVQSVKWAITLGSISGVRAKNEGMFGGKDVLFLDLADGDPAPEVKLEVKGSADNKAWADYISRAQAGEYILQLPEDGGHAPDLSVWEGEMPDIPTPAALGIAGAAGMMAGFLNQAKDKAAAEAAADAVAAHMRSVLGAKDDDKGDEKPSGGAKGMAAALQSQRDADDDEKVDGMSKAKAAFAEKPSKHDDEDDGGKAGFLGKLAQKSDDDDAPKKPMKGGDK
ncbi:MAG: hypothetical protein MUF38_11635 [Anaerolineae bacterium]|jgi:hypothetical protein|nr:hypothetical protein [Anaerolineae bacterium]